MQVYLVGGAVRDQLLGLRPHERDWVVVGATPQQMRGLGYRAVGRDFPVFLHPDTNEEYALARLERKVAPGYRGFIAEFAPQVTLEQDLERRDLTINAMAQRADGSIIDPFGGRADLERRLLRHVSPAFVEDPVRILRVARFAARYSPLGFRVAPETLALMRSMVGTGEAAALVPERVWRELERALGEPRPAAFFDTLAECGALAIVLPELVAGWSAPANQDDGTTARREDSLGARALGVAAAAGHTVPVRFAALVAGLAPRLLESLCTRLRTPNEHRELALLAARLGALIQAEGLPPATGRYDPSWQLELLERADAFRRPLRLAQWLLVLGARLVAAGMPAASAAELTAALDTAAQCAAAVRLDSAELTALRGAQIAARLHARRLEALGAATPDCGQRQPS
jgi:tRNA nucleotidyltransferase (CCA-adding enzyme)